MKNVVHVLISLLFLVISASSLPSWAGDLRGFVSDADTGRGIPQGRIEIYRLDGLLVRSFFWNGNGSYFASSVDEGSYYVHFSAFSLDYISETFENQACSRFCRELASPIFVPADGVIELNIDLKLGHSITGEVTTEDTGEPIPFCSAMVTNSQTLETTSGQCGFEGTFEIGGLPDGTYYLNTFPSSSTDDYVPELYDNLPCPPCNIADATTLEINGADVDVLVQLAKGATVSGQLQDISGSPIGEGFVNLIGVDSNARESARIEADGSFRIEGVGNGEYRLFVNPEGEFDDYIDTYFPNLLCPYRICDPGLADNVSVFGDDVVIDMQIQRGRSIKGIFRDGDRGEAIGDGLAWVRPFGVFTINNIVASANARVQGDGSYEIPGLPDATYSVWASASGYVKEVFENVVCFQVRPCSDGTPVELNGQDKIVDFSLDLGGTITGTVTENAGVGLNGSGIVRLYDLDGRLAYNAGITQAGLYLILGIAPGQYLLSFHVFGSSLTSEVYPEIECFSGQWCDVEIPRGSVIEITGPETFNIDAKLGDRVMQSGFESQSW